MQQIDAEAGLAQNLQPADLQYPVQTVTEHKQRKRNAEDQHLQR